MSNGASSRSAPESLPQVGKALGRWLLLLARIDARRPAAWLGLLAAVGSLPLIVQPLPMGLGVALGWWAGTLAVVAALGELPEETDAHGMPPVPWLAGRLLWPLAGWALGCGWAGGHHLPADIALAAGIVSGGAAVRTALLLRAQSADAASLALVLGGMAAAGAVTLSGKHGEAWGLTVAALFWLVSGTVAVLWGTVLAGLLPAGSAGPRARDEPLPLPVVGPLRRRLNSLAMVASLLGMVGWLFLDPSHAGHYRTMTLVWFVALAIPLAGLGNGAAHDRAWGWLYASAAVREGPDAGWVGRVWRPRLGSDTFSRAAVLSHAAILAWPPLVAALILAGDPAVSWHAAGTVVALAASGLGLVALERAGARLGWSGETTQAVALCGCIGVALAIGLSSAPGAHR